MSDTNVIDLNIEQAKKARAAEIGGLLHDTQEREKLWDSRLSDALDQLTAEFDSEEVEDWEDWTHEKHMRLSHILDLITVANLGLVASTCMCDDDGVDIYSLIDAWKEAKSGGDRVGLHIELEAIMFAHTKQALMQFSEEPDFSGELTHPDRGRYAELAAREKTKA